MSSVIDQLHQDHLHIVRLLDFVDREVAKAGTPERLDFFLLHDVLTYMTEYPDIYHHPREDRIFDALRGHDAVPGEEIDAVLAEHDRIISAGKRFLEAVDAVLRDQGMAIETFIELARAYSHLQRQHLNREEGVLFKAARRALTDEEWARIEAEFEVAPDPVFGGVSPGEYEHLLAAML
jgi:hemerythrin-like domain-containing protein